MALSIETPQTCYGAALVMHRFTQYHATHSTTKSPVTGGAGVVHESDKRGGDNPSRASELPSIIAPELSITGKVISDGVVHVESEQ